jgi:hypothetical protein
MMRMFGAGSGEPLVRAGLAEDNGNGLPLLVRVQEFVVA